MFDMTVSLISPETWTLSLIKVSNTKKLSVHDISGASFLTWRKSTRSRHHFFFSILVILWCLFQTKQKTRGRLLYVGVTYNVQWVEPASNKLGGFVCWKINTNMWWTYSTLFGRIQKYKYSQIWTIVRGTNKRASLYQNRSGNVKVAKFSRALEVK